ncbi:MAG: hypothetical protein Q9209_002453 [Squamulea sp. 1 TL-2023]
MSLVQTAFESAILASPILLLSRLGAYIRYILRQRKADPEARILPTKNPTQNTEGKATKFKVKKKDVEEDLRNEPDHWYMFEEPNKENFEDYWGYLFGGYEASKGHRHKYGESLAMEVAPVFCEHRPGTLTQIVVTFVFADGEEEGKIWREITIEVPSEGNWHVKKAWMDRIVHIREYDGYSVVIEIRDFGRSDFKAFRLAVDDLSELLEL